MCIHLPPPPPLRRDPSPTSALAIRQAHTPSFVPCRACAYGDRFECFGRWAASVAVPPLVGASPRSVAVDYRTVCIVSALGDLQCFGDASNARSKLLMSPPIDDPPDRFTKVSIGLYHACAIRESGLLKVRAGSTRTSSVLRLSSVRTSSRYSTRNNISRSLPPHHILLTPRLTVLGGLLDRGRRRNERLHCRRNDKVRRCNVLCRGVHEG